MDSESSSCFSWFVFLRESANKRWQCLRDRVRQAFSKNPRHVKNTEHRSSGKKTKHAKLVRTEKSRIDLKDGYALYLPPPYVLTPSDFSIWYAFFPHSTDQVCVSQVKPVTPINQTDFSIWCAFFPDSTTMVCSNKVKQIMPKIQTPASLGSNSMFPTIKQALPVFLSVISPSPVVTLSPVYRRQYAPIISLYVIAPTASLRCCTVSRNEVATASAVIPSTRLIIFPKDVMPRSVFSTAPSPSPADLKALMSSVRSMFACQLMAYTSKGMSAAKPMLSRSSIMPSLASLISPMTLSSSYSVSSIATGLISVVPAKVSVSSALMTTSGQVYALWPKIIKFLTLLSGMRPTMFSVGLPTARSFALHTVISLVPSARSSCAAESIASSARRISLMPSVFIAAVIVESNPNLTTASKVVITVVSPSGVCRNLPKSTAVESINQLADGGRLPMLLATGSHITSNILEHGTAVTTCESTKEPNCSAKTDEEQQVCAEDDDNFITTLLGCSPVAEFNESVVKCRPDPQPGSRVSQRKRTAARLERNQEGYDKDTFQIFRQNEGKYKADPGYIERQAYITNEMRSTTISWMAEIADYVEMSHTCLFLSVNFFDRFMSECIVTKNNLQLVAVTCMFMAGKIEKGDEAALVGDYVYLTADTYISDQIFGLEKLILMKLQFNLYAPTAAWFCKELLDVCEADTKLEYMTMYLAEMTMLDVSYINDGPSIIAAASLCLARHSLGLPVWTLELWERSYYLPNDIFPCIKSILETCAFYRNIEDDTKQGIPRKYSAEKYQEIASVAKYLEQEIESLEKKCLEFGASAFVSPSRSSCRRWRCRLFSGRDTPLTYDPNAETLPLYKTRTKKKCFEGYSVEIYKIMFDSECKHRANPEYMKSQTNINISRRQEEVNWMMYFIELGKYPTSSLLLAVNLMDRFMSLYLVKNHMLRLVAVACLFIVTKYEVMCYRTIDVFIGAAGRAYSKQQIIGMEKLILTALDFNLVVPTAAWFCEELFDVCSADDTLRALTRYLVELTTLEIRYLNYRPSHIAAAALCIARYSLGLPPWTKKLLERSDYELEDFLGCLRSLYDDYKLSQCHQGELQCKFRKLEYMEVADFSKYPVPDIFSLLELYFKEMDQT